MTAGKLVWVERQGRKTYCHEFSRENGNKRASIFYLRITSANSRRKIDGSVVRGTFVTGVAIARRQLMRI